MRNAGPASIQASGLFLSATTDFSDKLALSGSIPASGYASWDTNFDAGGDGEITVYLIDAQNNVLGAVELAHVAGRDSVQAWPETGREWFNSSASTRNA